MNRLVYLLYASIVVLISTAINARLESTAAGSYRSWGGGSGYSSGSGWSGSGHK